MKSCLKKTPKWQKSNNLFLDRISLFKELGISVAKKQR